MSPSTAILQWNSYQSVFYHFRLPEVSCLSLPFKLRWFNSQKRHSSWRPPQTNQDTSYATEKTQKLFNSDAPYNTLQNGPKRNDFYYPTSAPNYYKTRSPRLYPTRTPMSYLQAEVPPPRIVSQRVPHPTGAPKAQTQRVHHHFRAPKAQIQRVSHLFGAPKAKRLVPHPTGAPHRFVRYSKTLTPRKLANLYYEESQRRRNDRRRRVNSRISKFANQVAKNLRKRRFGGRGILNRRRFNRRGQKRVPSKVRNYYKEPFTQELQIPIAENCHQLAEMSKGGKTAIGRKKCRRAY